MKNLFIVTIVISIICISDRTSQGAQYWAKAYGGSGKEEAYSIQQTSDGGYIVLGSTYSYDAGRDLLILKLDGNGNVSWQKTYGRENADCFARSIQQTSTGNFIAVGHKRSFNTGNNEMWVFEFDDEGNILWQKAYGGADTEVGYQILSVLDGGYIVAGFTNSFGAGYSDIWVLKLDDNGNVSWQKSYGGSDSDESFSSIQQTLDGGYIVAGETTPFWPGHYDILVLKLDKDGYVSWQKTYGRDPHDEHDSRIQQTTDGGYIVACYSYFFTNPPDTWVAKLNSNGDILWEKDYYVGEYDYHHHPIQPFDLEVTSTGYIIAGHTTPYFTDQSDIRLLKLDDSGNISWLKNYGGGGFDYPSVIQHTLNDDYIMAGYTHSYGVDGGDILVLKLDTNGEIPPCQMADDRYHSAWDTSVEVTKSNFTIQVTDAIITDTKFLSRDSDVEITIVCEGDVEITTTTSTIKPQTTSIVPITTTTTIKGICASEAIYGGNSKEAGFLRYIRDDVLNQSPEGQELIKLYYQWSPTIVKAMENDEEFKEDIKELIDGVLELITETE